jgi:hypothetical protein
MILSLWSLFFRCPLWQPLPDPVLPRGFARFQTYREIRNRTPSIIRSSLPKSGARLRRALASSTIATSLALTILIASNESQRKSR